MLRVATNLITSYWLLLYLQIWGIRCLPPQKAFWMKSSMFTGNIPKKLWYHKRFLPDSIDHVLWCYLWYTEVSIWWALWLAIFLSKEATLQDYQISLESHWRKVYQKYCGSNHFSYRHGRIHSFPPMHTCKCLLLRTQIRTFWPDYFISIEINRSEINHFWSKNYHSFVVISNLILLLQHFIDDSSSFCFFFIKSFISFQIWSAQLSSVYL